MRVIQPLGDDLERMIGLLCPLVSPPPITQVQGVFTETEDSVHTTPTRLLLSVRPTPRGGVGGSGRISGWVGVQPPPPPGVGWDFVGALGSIEPVPLLSFFCCRFHVTCLFMVRLHGIAYHVCMPHAHNCDLVSSSELSSDDDSWTDMMVVHLCEKLGLLYCMSQLGTWVGGWVGGCHICRSVGMPKSPRRGLLDQAQVRTPYTPPFWGSFAYHTPRYGTGCPTPCRIIILGEKMIPH